MNGGGGGVERDNTIRSIIGPELYFLSTKRNVN